MVTEEGQAVPRLKINGDIPPRHIRVHGMHREDFNRLLGSGDTDVQS